MYMYMYFSPLSVQQGCGDGFLICYTGCYIVYIDECKGVST